MHLFIRDWLGWLMPTVWFWLFFVVLPLAIFLVMMFCGFGSRNIRSLRRGAAHGAIRERGFEKPTFVSYAINPVTGGDAYFLATRPDRPGVTYRVRANWWFGEIHLDVTAIDALAPRDS